MFSQRSRNKATGQSGLSRLGRGLIYSHLFMAAAVTVGCGGGGSSDSTAVAEEQGEVALAITDAEGDFLSYTVELASITLEKANGAVVETVPLNTRIDFAQYTDMTEFFTIRTLPAGNYTKVNLNLDYSDAEIIVQNEEGEPVTASVVDTEGDPITDFTVNVTLDEDRVLKIRKGVPAALTIDFDLDSSNTILSYDPAVVEVEPFILASAEWDTEREHRGRGLLSGVDVDAQTFSMLLRPFRHHNGSFGEVTLQSAETTEYEVNGIAYTGADGIDALNTLEENTPMLVYGQVASVREFNALRVLAGSSVPWVGRDSARGVVIARNGDVLTLRGSHVDREDGSATFYDNIQVTLGDTTRVTRQALSNEGLDKEAVSIGQRVVVFGEMSGEVAGQYTLDASTGHVRMLMNLIKGEVTSVSPLVVDLRWINGRRLNLFDFSGTGMTAENDADPDAYDIDPASLSLSGLELGSLVKVRGYPAAFGSAPLDFTAQTLVDINTEQRAAAMNVVWTGEGSMSPFIASNADSLVLDVSEARFSIKLAGVPVTLNDGLQTDPSLVPLLPSGNGVYAVKVAGQPAIQIYKNFADYVDALNLHLNDGHAMRRMVSLGRFDQSEDQMHSMVITSRFRP